jgi:hypothetical protein
MGFFKFACFGVFRTLGFAFGTMAAVYAAPSVCPLWMERKYRIIARDCPLD